MVLCFGDLGHHKRGEKEKRRQSGTERKKERKGEERNDGKIMEHFILPTLVCQTLNLFSANSFDIDFSPLFTAPSPSL